MVANYFLDGVSTVLTEVLLVVEGLRGSFVDVVNERSGLGLEGSWVVNGVD